MVEKIIRDGKVAVLVSPDYGAGWTTWNTAHPDVEKMLYDVDIVTRILEWEKAGSKKRILEWEKAVSKNWEQCLLKITEIAQAKYNQNDDFLFYDGGLRDIQIVWVDQGRKFIIEEYDGAESIRFLDETDWYTA